MNLELIGIKDLDTDKERIELIAIGNDNASNYVLVFPSDHENIAVANKSRHAFWFPNQSFKKGDTIRVFTKSGTTSSFMMADKSRRYTFYWGVGSVYRSENRTHPKLLRIIESISVS